MTDWRRTLAGWIRTQIPAADAVEVRRVFPMAAGASNDTAGIDITVSCEGHSIDVPLVLRTEREDGILAPYDVAREFRVMRALQCEDVPAPGALWLETSGGVLGRRFFFMDRVPGETLPLFWYGGRSPRLRQCAEMLARVHAVDWRTMAAVLGSGAAGRVIAGELAPWRSRARTAGIDSYPLLIALGEWLERNEPADARRAFLHGDPNPGNYLFEGERVTAVVDWELASIGDRRSDLGFYAALLAVFGGGGMNGGRTLLSDAYADATGERLGALDYYAAFGLYRMAVIAAGWARRLNGMTGYYGFEAIGRELDALLGPRWAM